MPGVCALCVVRCAPVWLTPQLLEQRKRGVLMQQQIDRVSSELVGWRWDERVRAPPLDRMLEVMREFVQQHGRLPRQTEVGWHVGKACEPMVIPCMDGWAVQ